MISRYAKIIMEPRRDSASTPRPKRQRERASFGPTAAASFALLHRSAAEPLQEDCPDCDGTGGSAERTGWVNCESCAGTGKAATDDLVEANDDATIMRGARTTAAVTVLTAAAEAQGETFDPAKMIAAPAQGGGHRATAREIMAAAHELQSKA